MSISHFIPVIPPKHEHRLLGLMLLTLHGTLWWNFYNVFTYLFLLIHFYFFILWQPLWGIQDVPKTKNWSILIVGILLFVIFSNELLISAWQITLLGLMGGRDLVRLRDRFVNIAAMIFLLLELFINIHQVLIIGNLPIYSLHLFDIQSFFGESLLLIIPCIFLFVSTDNSVEYRYHIDFFHGLTFSLLIIIIILGSLIIMSYEEISYPLAIFQISLAIALFVLIISWLWVFLTDGENIEQLWVRHLFNIGSSFEQWLANLAQPKNYRALTPKQFLHTGFEQLVTLPWIAGIAWHSLYGDGFYGYEGKHQVTISLQSIEATIYARHRINGFHIRLLIQLLEYFHQAKRREEAFAQQAHLQAIHETGAKLTHDIKNLLQSLQAITSAIETCQPEQFGNTQKLLQGQMPLLTQRLKLTLDKFQKPTEFSYSNVPVTLWWSNLQARYGKQSINFFSKIHIENVLVPEDLFDNVVENLLQNALMKRKREPNLHIDVDLYIDKQKLKLTVCDDGSPIPPEIAKDLLLRPLHSRDGFGIGLYQAAKQLAHTGYRLSIVENNEGQVCFELGSSDS
ncbi:MAG: hypothetical protein BWK79_15485 [Beggiatoa sp. IS2]|nr:MAG: hypothetical protein BWK79_15485 [Beggiatoa sp. IS2]